jgi:hypothetical protein
MSRRTSLVSAPTVDSYRPFWEVGIGTALILLVLFTHGFAMFAVQGAFDKWFPRVEVRRDVLLRNLLIAGAVLSLLAIHYVEILMWAFALYAVEAFDDLRSAFYFAGGAYTTYGSGSLALPENWRLLGFMIATSGLFTFAWTAGILIGVMNRFHDAARGPTGTRIAGGPSNVGDVDTD